MPTTELVPIPFHGQQILAIEIDGKPELPFRPLVESIGLSFDTQVRKLKTRSWAVIARRGSTAADGKTYEMLTIDLKTLGMWLATLNENRVAPHVKEAIILYQAHAANAIEQYFFKEPTQKSIDRQLVDILVDKLADERAQKLVPPLKEARLLEVTHLIEKTPHIWISTDGRDKCVRVQFKDGHTESWKLEDVRDAITAVDIEWTQVLPPLTGRKGVKK